MQRTDANLIWSVADLRGDYKQSEYGKVILPLTVIRRLDSVCDRADPSSKAPSSPKPGLVMRHAGSVICLGGVQRVAGQVGRRICVGTGARN
jgi:hypothetical protein